MSFIISTGAKTIINTLEKSGFKAYIVGGAVRDMLMNKTPHDFDIATSALPEQIKKIFRRTIDTGLKHGTVTVVENNVGYEVTTFRSESGYTDSRHPDSVNFITSIEEDVKRRDFTINAMAYNPHNGLFDCVGGTNDLENKIVRCVGVPEVRFSEDPLRMLRAVRFAAQLNFEIDSECERAIKKLAPLIKKVSSERIREELNKILMSENSEKISILHNLGLLKLIIPEVDLCSGVAQKNKYHIYDVYEHIMHTVKSTPPDMVLRWSALLHDIGKPNCASCDSNGIIHFYGHHRESVRMANDILHRLHFDSETAHDILILIENHDVRIENTPPGVKRMMAKTGARLFEKLIMLQEADNKAKNEKFFREKKKRLDETLEIYGRILSEHQPYMISDLTVNGRDLIKIGYKPGRSLGDCLKRLLDEVIINPELNRREYLLAKAKEIKKSGAKYKNTKMPF